MVRKILAAGAVIVEFVAMGGFVIPELALPSRSAFTQLFVMSSYLLLLKWTWCVVAGRKKKNERTAMPNEADAKCDQTNLEQLSFAGFLQKNASILLALVGILVAMLLVTNRYRIMTANNGDVYRFDRFSGRGEKLVGSWDNLRFIPIREHEAKKNREKTEARNLTSNQKQSEFDLTKLIEESKRKKNANQQGWGF